MKVASIFLLMLLLCHHSTFTAGGEDIVLTPPEQALLHRLKIQARREGIREGKLYAYKMAMFIGLAGSIIFKIIEWHCIPINSTTAQQLPAQDEAPSP